MGLEVRIRDLEKEDVDGMLSWVNDEEVTCRFAKFNHKVTREEEEAYVGRMMSSETDKVFTIEADGNYAGNVALHEMDDGKARLALIIPKPYWGKGCGTQAVKQALCWAFSNDIEKVYLKVIDTNAKARHVYGKCGFRETKFLPGHYECKGKFYNMIQMEITKQGGTK